MWRRLTEFVDTETAVARIVSFGGGAASVFGGQTYFEYYYTAIAC